MKKSKAVTKIPLKGPELKIDKKHIMAFPDGRFIWFQSGGFNDWFVNTDPFPEPKGTPPSETMNFDKDEQMLAQLLSFQDAYGPYVMSHMWSIYNLVKVRTDENPVVPAQKDWDLLMEWASKYEEAEKVSQLFGYVYYAMISEENYEGTLLGKKLKMLGIYQTLVEGISPRKAACWSRCGSSEVLAGSPGTRRAFRLEEECRIRGIF